VVLIDFRYMEESLENGTKCSVTSARRKCLKGLCNWFFFFIFRLKIVSREEKVEKKVKKINKSWRKPRNRAVWTADMRSTAHRAADL
jgi:hypothetical protein